MTATRLTEKRIRDLKPNTAALTFRWDGAIPGFGIRISKGGAKAFVLWIRGEGTGKRLLTLGRWPALSLEDARAAATGELSQIERGGDDLLARRAKRLDGLTVAQGAEWYIQTYVPRRQGLGKMAPRTAAEYRHQLARYIVPSLGHMQISAVERKHVEQMLDKIGPSKPIQYARVRALSRSLFNRFAVEGWLKKGDNPATDISVPTERARERVLSAAEQSGFLAALARLGDSPGTLVVRMLYEIGSRLTEIRTAKWSYVDHDAKALRLPETKTGAQAYALTDGALAVLAKCRKVHDNEFVFAGRGGNFPIGQKVVRAVFHEAARMASLDDVRIHDLRRTAIVDALESGIPLTVVSRMFNHSSILMTGRYAKHARVEIHEGANGWRRHVGHGAAPMFLPWTSGGRGHEGI